MVNIVKASNEVEQFKDEKILQSIKRTGIPHELQQAVLAHVQNKLYDNITSQEIYKYVAEFLDKSAYPYAKTKYALKQAIMDLGPTGYPFEDFVSEILNTLGYTTQVRQYLSGKCVTHEVDVIAKKDNEAVLVEAKFHNSNTTRSDVHVPMYTKARFDDVKDKYNLNQAWVVTNTKVTVDAITFAQCVGMKIISWSYPEGSSLRDLIENAGLHPITILTTIPNAYKAKLLEKHIVRCKSIHENPGILSILALSDEEKRNVLAEIEFVCKGEHAVSSHF